MIWSLIASVLTNLIKPLFDFLNKKVDANLQMHILDTTTMGTIAAGGIAAAAEADKLNAQIRTGGEKWGPMVIMMTIILIPFVWHEWQVVLDSSRWIPAWGGWYPVIQEHTVGSWKIPALPDPWGTVELAIFQSFFIGATAAATAVAAIRAIKR